MTISIKEKFLFLTHPHFFILFPWWLITVFGLFFQPFWNPKDIQTRISLFTIISILHFRRGKNVRRDINLFFLHIDRLENALLSDWFIAVEYIGWLGWQKRIGWSVLSLVHEDAVFFWNKCILLRDIFLENIHFLRWFLSLLILKNILRAFIHWILIGFWSLYKHVKWIFNILVTILLIIYFIQRRNKRIGFWLLERIFGKVFLWYILLEVEWGVGVESHGVILFVLVVEENLWIFGGDSCLILEEVWLLFE